MEVHHHAHTARKKWTHYFWEFLMLFLAVFCGFMAEYQLEHKIEKNRGKQYIYSFYEDLINDSTRYSSLLSSYEQKINGLEKSIACYHDLKENNSKSPCLIQLLIHSNSFRDIASKDRTLKQLKNAGGFRLLNEKDAYSVLQYDDKLERSLIVQRMLQEAQSNIRNTMSLIFDVDLMDDIIFQRDSVLMNIIPGKILVTQDHNLVIKFFNELTIYRDRVIQQKEDIEALLTIARNLILYFKDKYSY